MEKESEKMLDVTEPTTDVTDELTDDAETQSEEIVEEIKEPSKEETVEKTTEEKEEKETQSKEENAKFAQMRRKIESESKQKLESEKKKAYEEGRLSAYTGKINPYTDKPISDLADIEMYEAMFNLDKEGKDPIKDLPDYLATKRREEQKSIQEKKDAEIKASQELDEFRSKYPNEDINALFKNEFFSDYISGKNKSLTELYEGFNNFKNAFRNSAVEVAKQTIANVEATPGSLSGNPEVSVDYASMSDAEFEKIVNAVKNGDLK